MKSCVLVRYALVVVIGLCYLLLVQSADGDLDLNHRTVLSGQWDIKHLDDRRMHALAMQISNNVDCYDFMGLRSAYKHFQKLAEYRKDVLLHLLLHPGSPSEFQRRLQEAYEKILSAVEPFKNAMKAACHSNPSPAQKVISRLEGLLSKRLELAGGPKCDFELDDKYDFKPGHRFENPDAEDHWSFYVKLVDREKCSHLNFAHILEDELAALDEDRRQLSRKAQELSSLNEFLEMRENNIKDVGTRLRSIDWYSRSAKDSSPPLLGVRQNLHTSIQNDMRKTLLTELRKVHHEALDKFARVDCVSEAEKAKYDVQVYLFERIRALEECELWHRYKHQPDPKLTKQFARYRANYCPEWDLQVSRY